MKDYQVLRLFAKDLTKKLDGLKHQYEHPDGYRSDEAWAEMQTEMETYQIIIQKLELQADDYESNTVPWDD